jgi:hypothetical protein
MAEIIWIQVQDVKQSSFGCSESDLVRGGRIGGSDSFKRLQPMSVTWRAEHLSTAFDLSCEGMMCHEPPGHR